MKITISNEIIENVDKDGSIVSRIPKSNLFLHLQPEAVLEKGKYSILADLDPARYYIVADKNDKAFMKLGAEILKSYSYEALYDPVVQQRAKGLEEKQQYKKQQVETYNKEQFKQLKLGQHHHVDISQIWDIHLSAKQMKELRFMLEAGINISVLGYNNPAVSPEKLKELRAGHLEGFNMNSYDWQQLSANQLKEIRLGLEKGVDVQQYADNAYTAAQMQQLRLGLQTGFDIIGYKNPCFTAQQMMILRLSQVVDRIKIQIRKLFESIKDLFRTERQEVAQETIKIQNIPEETLEERIQEAVLEIKELLVTQELVSEQVMMDKEASEKMYQRIREAIDELMQPDIIQNIEKQEKVIQNTADAIIRQTGKVPVQENQSITDIQFLSDKDLFDLIGEEMIEEELIDLEY